MIHKLSENKYFPFFLFIFAFAVYAFFSWLPSIYILDEAKNASCAREMLEQRNWLVPTFNYTLRTDKPPLHYFFMMLSYSIFGVNPFAARFFSAVFGALTVLITFFYVKKFANTCIAFWTVCILLASVHLGIQFHLSVPDPYLIFFFTWSLFLFFSALQNHSKRDAILMYLAIGAGTLAKGPVAILLPGLIFFLYLLISKQFKWSVIARLKPFLGIAIVLVVALPWYLLNGIQTHWEWTEGFFFKHNINRFSGEMEGHGGSFLITLVYVLIGLFPFSFFLPQAIKNASKNRADKFLLFNLVAGLTIVAFFAVSQTKLPNYTVPAYPLLATILGFYLANSLHFWKQIKINYIFLLIISFLIPIAIFIGTKYDSSLLPIKRFIALVLMLPIGVGLSWFLRKNLPKMLLGIAFSSLFFALLFFSILFPIVDRQNPVSRSLPLLENKNIISYKRFNPSYAFYLKQKIEVIDNSQELNSFFTEHPEGIAISTKQSLKEIDTVVDYQIIFSAKDLFETPTTVLITAKKK